MSQSQSIDGRTVPGEHSEAFDTGQLRGDDKPGDPRPCVVELFDRLGSEWRYLPYDPDAVCRAVITNHDHNAHISDVHEMSDLVEQTVGIDFPEHVVEHAARTGNNEYYPTEIDVLLHMMQAHGELIASGSVDPDTGVRTGVTYEYTNTNRTFNTVRTLRVRTEQAIHHLGRSLRHCVTHSTTRVKSLFTSNQQ